MPGAARPLTLLAMVALLTTGCGGGDPKSASPDPTAADPTVTTTSVPGVPDPTVATTATTVTGARVIEATYAGGQVVGGLRTETVRVGDEVVLRVTSDVAEEVHVHTYDVTADVTAGGTAELTFTATIPGRHEVELEKKRKLLLVLEVR